MTRSIVVVTCVLGLLLAASVGHAAPPADVNDDDLFAMAYAGELIQTFVLAFIAGQQR